MPFRTDNLFHDIPSSLQNELFQTLAESDTIRIERIVSDGHSTAPGEWFDQEWHEWVLLVSGEATIRFENSAVPLIMQPGDHVMIPANCRHRVERTDPGQKTIWLAVHYNGNVPHHP